ncbi:MAG: GumC family protein [Armatimonadota bacterium]
MSSDNNSPRLPARMEPLHPAQIEDGPRSIATLEAYEPPTTPLRDYVSVLQRRKWAVVITLGVVLAATVVVTALTPRTYESAATLLISEIDPKSGKTTDTQTAMAAMGSPNLDTHVQLIQGDATAEQTAKWLVEHHGPALSAQQVRQRVSARSVRDTQLIRVVARAHAAEEAQMIAGAAAQTYVSLNRERARGSSETTGRHLEEQLAIARAKLTRAEDDLRSFREASGTVASDAAAADVLARTASLRTSAEATEADLAQARAQTGRIRAQLAEQNLSIKSGQVRDNAVVQQLRQKLADLEGQRLSAQAKYTADYPGPIAQIDEQIRLVNQQLDAEIRHIVGGTGGDLELQQRLTGDLIKAEAESAALKARYQQLQRELARSNQELAKIPARQVTLANLQLQVDVARNSYSQLLQRSQEVEVGRVMALGNADIVESASLPRLPVKPNVPMNLTLGLLLGLALGVGVALVQDQLDDTVRDQGEASRLAAAPVLGTIPVFQPNGSAKALAAGGPRSIANEAYRALRHCLDFVTQGERGRVVLVTSPGQYEGKTTTVWNLARAVAMTGRRVILVDTDLRRGGLGRLLGMHQAKGVTDVLLGEVTVQQALQKHAESGIRFLGAGREVANHTELLDSEPMRQLLRDLRSEADLVILDSPPVLAVADSLVLARLSDDVLMVCVAGQSHRHELELARRLLSRVGESVSGVVLNKIGEKAGYGYSGRYYYQ